MAIAIRQFETIRTTPIEEETIPLKNIEIIGTARGRQYARTKDGRELRIGKEILPAELANPLREGQVRIEHSEMVKDPMRAFPMLHTRRYLAEVVPNGSYELAQQREQSEQITKAERRNPPYRPIDALAVVPALATKQPEYLLGPAPDSMVLKQDAIVIRGRPAIRGPRAIIEYLGREGLILKATPDGQGILAYAQGDVRGGRPKPALREVIRATARLLAGELTGNPVTCELCRGKQREPAVTIVEVDVAVCERHASEAVPA